MAVAIFDSQLLGEIGVISSQMTDKFLLPFPFIFLSISSSFAFIYLVTLSIDFRITRNLSYKFFRSSLPSLNSEHNRGSHQASTPHLQSGKKILPLHITESKADVDAMEGLFSALALADTSTSAEDQT
ncbi:unnamed protein product [Linum trigynum]|uniref:Uncharacterized protein n=1 Tax=Linum trigynum TaxID=586398 RepID=A0AAV2EPV7_9ROSI